MRNYKGAQEGMTGNKERDAFTIRIFVPDGDPEGVRVVDRMTSTGIAVSFPRDLWPRTKSRPEFGKAGVYVLVGFSSDDDLPTLYIGQGDGTRSRIAAHYDQKDFWIGASSSVPRPAMPA